MANQDKIEKYVFGEMTPEEQQAFGNEMQQNPELAEEVKLEKATKRGLELYGSNQRRQQTRQQINRLRSQKKFRIKVVKYAAVAAMLLLMATIPLYLLMKVNVSDKKILSFLKQETHFGTKSASSESVFANGNKLYTEGDWQGAIDTLKKISITASRYNDAQLLIGICQLTLEQPEAAIAALTAVKTEKNMVWANWYLGFAKLKTGDEDGAKLHFQLVADEPRHEKSEDARKILKKLNSFWR